LDRPDVFIDASADVHPEAEIGAGTKIWNWTKIRDRVRIGSGCIIGQCIYIDADVVIGDRCKIQNGVSVYHGVSIGNGVFVGPNATFTNDQFPRAESVDWEVVPTIVEDGASIGANATIRCGVRIGAFAMIAAGAVVTRDVPPFGLVMGQPAALVDYVDRSGRPLHHAMSDRPPSHERLMRGTREE
jgi:acetyltransferase-like isoleucine patch superfamily enzyme